MEKMRTLQVRDNKPKLAQKSGQLQPFIAVLVFPQACTGQLASFGPT
jgi:hypothetical protein